MPIRLKTLFVALLLLAGCEEAPEARERSLQTPYELGNGNTTATYPEILEFYQRLAREFPEVNLQTLGVTDSGEPLHLVTYNPEGAFNFQKLGAEKAVVLVLNGIHPGEPDGIDATSMLMRDLATGAVEIPENVVLASIAVYNVGGALNRNSTSRANQNGPELYGFRGNARNYDLNRDFVKMDTRNARTFAQIFRLVRPVFFVDTHVSNGADYSYTLTHLFTQHNKLGGSVGPFQETTLRPALEASLAEKGWDITPYVNVFNRPPEGGFSQFMDSPRYSTGYTALWNVPGLMVETHMLKPYQDRVRGTYDLLHSALGLAGSHAGTLRDLRDAALKAYEPSAYYPLAWQVDSTTYQTLKFKGYRADTIPSRVTGQPRLKYHRDEPVTSEVRYFNHFRAVDSVRIPRAYLLPRGWDRIRERLDWNGITYQELDRDTTLEVTAYRIEDYQTYSRPYEGHYPHYNTRVSRTTKNVRFRAGDLYIPTGQEGVRFLLETLEPGAVDSFFNWNFFDPILQRKEGFSPYVFEETARALLESDAALRKAFEQKRQEDPEFAANGYRQLSWLYERSPHFEEAYLQYPVYRLEP
ncbi:MAG: M14 family metallopeptidase [Robiginitalea sp.]|nr:M14 family metallopeptidase [Robiginitalea sp.]